MAICAMLFLALSNVFAKKTLVFNNVYTVALWTNLITQLAFITTVPMFVKSISNLKIKQFMPLVLLGLSAMIGTITVNLAYKENVSITSVILAVPTSMIIAVAASFFVPGLLEKHTAKIYAIRFTAAAVMIMAALRLSSTL